MCAIALVVASAGYAIVELSCESKTLMFLSLRFFAFGYWLLILIFFYIVTRRIQVSAWICLGLAEFIGLGNYCVMQFRGSYVMYGDLLVIGTALEVAGNYKLVMDRYFYIPLAITAVAALLVWVLYQPLRGTKEERLQRKQGKLLRKGTPEGKKALRKRWGSTIIGLLCLSLFVGVGMYNGFLFDYIKGNGWNYTQEVEEHGYMPYFFSNIMATAQVKLKGYDAEIADNAIEEGAAAYDETHETATVQEPNIIVIQNEAFSDLSVVYDYELSEDCLPFIHSLTENTQKGYVNTSVTGGPTANTEFEFLTRYSFAYLSTGSIAYAQYVKAKMPSLLTVLQNQENPYYTIGFHPYHASGYNRESVYQTLGFDEGIFYEDTTGMDRIRSLLSDRGDYQDVISMYEENEATREQPLFLFNVTIQNHSPFTYLNDNLDSKVEVTSFTGTKGINNYFTLIRESDAAFQELVEYFENVDEPTIILMYGDHQPSWDDDSKKVWDEHFISEDSAEQTRDKYYVPYIMWANYDIEEYDGLCWGDNPGEKNVISMNYLSSLLLENAGVELSDYDKYLLNLRETIPAITSKGWWDAMGTWHDNADALNLTEERSDYHQICYNILFDKKNHLWERFE
jgi:phosphoglycerol transferase MdoB-like AlkP superfamily enzyme